MILSIGRAVHAETLKLKRTLAVRMVFVAPILVALLGLFVQSAQLVRGGGKAAPAAMWASFSRESLAVWAIFLMPLLIALETALVCGIEHGEKQWKHLFALPTPRYAIYAAKFFVVQGLILSGTLVVSILIAVSGWALTLWVPALATAGAPPIWSIVGRALECWLAAGLILAANPYFSH